jgi:hypothetical protein
MSPDRRRPLQLGRAGDVEGEADQHAERVGSLVEFDEDAQPGVENRGKVGLILGSDSD